MKLLNSLGLNSALALGAMGSGEATAQTKPNQAVAKQTQATTDTVTISKAEVKAVTNPVSKDPLDARDQRFADSPLGKVLQKDMPVKLGEDGFPVLDQKDLAKLAEIIEKNPEGIGAGFGLKGGTGVKVKAAIYVHDKGDKKAPSELKGTVLLFLEKPVSFTQGDKQINVENLVGRYYVKRHTADGKEAASQQVRLSNEGKIGINAKTGTIEGNPEFQFIGANPPTRYKIQLSPTATSSKVSKSEPINAEGKVVTDPEKNKAGIVANRITIEIPTDTATIYVPRN